MYEISDLRRLIDDGAQVIDVLPAKEYDETHLPGAVNIPLHDMTADAVRKLDTERTVIVYCFDFQCDLSPRAAARLDLLGFRDVVDYVPGEAAWIAAGEPSEGHVDDAERIGRLARPDIGQCETHESVADVRDRFGDWPVCVILADRTVVGVVGPDVTTLPPDTRVADVLQPGPKTVRPDLTRDEMARRFSKDDLTYVLVTTYAGQFVGALRPSDVEPR